MEKVLKRKHQQAQIFAEYTLLIGVVVGLLVSMSVMIRRGVQMMVKVTADQIGIQNEADQREGLQGHLINIYAVTRQDSDVHRQQLLSRTTHNTVFAITEVRATTFTNLGFTETEE